MTIKTSSQHVIQTVTTAIFIAVIPPLWAVLSPKFGVETGAVALISAGLFTAKGNDPKKALPIILGLLIGIPWGMVALKLTALPGSPSMNQFLSLCILGAVSVLVCGLTVVGRFVDATAWLSGWAITILVLGHETMTSWHWLPLQLAFSMLVGVYLIGVGGVVFNNWFMKHDNK